jgi:mono/diheme cytochrome c family protein
MTRQGLLLVLLAAVAVAGEPDAAAVYRARCAPCHGTTGRSDTPQSRSLKVAPLVHDASLARATPAEIAARVRADPKHRAVADVRDADLEIAARWVRHLAGAR